MPAQKLPFRVREVLCQNKAARLLCRQIADKASNLVLAADVTEPQELLRLADQLGPVICLLKTHIDLLTDFIPELPTQLRTLALKHHFLICEDRKFADIGYTVQRQYYGGLYRIADWADFITVHTIAGPSTLEGLKQQPTNFSDRPRGVFLISEMSSEGQLALGSYTQNSQAIAAQYPDLIAGFIGQSNTQNHPTHLKLTPGIRLETHAGDNLGQRYLDPIAAIQETGSDLIIAGRGILEATDPLKKAEQYRQAAWVAYTSCYN